LQLVAATSVCHFAVTHSLIAAPVAATAPAAAATTLLTYICHTHTQIHTHTHLQIYKLLAAK